MTIGLFDALRREHEKVLALADRLDEQANTAQDDQALERTLDEAWVQVLTSDTLEARTLHAHLARDRNTSETAEEAREQSAQTEQLLAEVRSMRKDPGGRLARRVHLLTQRLRDHVAWKEDELLQIAAKALSSEEVRALGERVAAERDAVAREIASSGS